MVKWVTMIRRAVTRVCVNELDVMSSARMKMQRKKAWGHEQGGGGQQAEKEEEKRESEDEEDGSCGAQKTWWVVGDERKTAGMILKASTGLSCLLY